MISALRIFVMIKFCLFHKIFKLKAVNLESVYFFTAQLSEMLELKKSLYKNNNYFSSVTAHFCSVNINLYCTVDDFVK